MRNLAIATIAVLAATTLVFAEDAALAGGAVAITGTIIDNACAGAQTPEQLATFIKTHTKECLLAPACEASGFNILVAGKLIRFDKASSVKVGDFLRKAASRPDVVVTGRMVGDAFELTSIENQK